MRALRLVAIWYAAWNIIPGIAMLVAGVFA